MRDWGICEAPEVVRVKDGPLWAGAAPPEPLVPQPWPPAASSPEWHGACRRILEAFEVHVGTALREAGLPPLRRSRLKLVHPADEPLLEAVRAIHNGEIPEEQPLPRVWRYEVEWQAVWIVELTA